jgi:penicillin-binding protein A
MNRPIRKLGAALAILLAAIFVNLNFVQVVKGSDYRNNPNNQRVLLTEYANPRGQIVVQGGTIALSKRTSDELRYLRVYPQGALYSAVTGFYSINVSPSPYLGTTGIEGTENSILSGSDSRLFVAQLSGLLTGRNPKGGSVELTLNKAAQQAAYQAMKGGDGTVRAGAVVALNPSTGAILAAVSTPSFDPNALSSHDQSANLRAYNTYCRPDKSSGDCANPDNPMQNRAFNQLYPAGSVFKVIVSAAALRAGVKSDQQVPAPNGYWPYGDGSGGCPNDPASSCVENYQGETCLNAKTAPLLYAFAKSCNTAFAALAVDKLGGQRVADEARLFGLDGAQLSVPLPVARSTVGTAEDLADKGKLSHTAFGQQDVRITPLQGAMLAAAVANKGSLMRPYLVAKEQGPNLSVLSQAAPTLMNQVLDADVDQQLQAMMEAVITSPEGTANNFGAIPGYVVGGKTGTADTGQYSNAPTSQPDAWFIGYARQGSTAKIAVAVLLEHAGVNGNEVTGGQAAAPVAKAVMQAYLDSGGGH